MKDLVSGTLTSYTEYSKLMPSCGPLVSPRLRVSLRGHCRYTYRSDCYITSWQRINWQLLDGEGRGEGAG